LNRFGAALNLDERSLNTLFDSVAQEIKVLTSQAGLGGAGGAELEHVEGHEPEEPGRAEAGSETAAEAEPELGLPSELLMQIDEPKQDQAQGKHPSGKPLDAREQLMAGVQDVTEMMASGRCKVNDLIMLVLETIYRGMGFRFATVCINDPKTGNYRARISVGEQAAARQEGFVFPSAHARDVFHLSMENDADLMIADAMAVKIRDLIPAWHRSLLPDAKSFIVLPLIVQKKPFGLFYADRAMPAPEGVPPDETALIRTLKGQVLAALNAR
ncbi:MAG TPA: signal transduction protein, partial [Burkholderiaceae bacterium]